MPRLPKFIREYFRPSKLRLGSQDDAMLRCELGRLPRDGIFVDFGANVGNVTDVALDFGHKVFAFEPDPRALAILNRRFGSNPRVAIVPKAIGGSARTATFHLGRDDGTYWSSLLPHEMHQGSYQVEVVDIVQFLKQIGPVTVVKMDIEGAEIECLNAMIDAGLHENIGSVLVETHERFSPEMAADIAALRATIRDRQIANINLEWA